MSSQTIAENDKLKLDYNEEFRSISITNKISGKVWSNVVVDENGETESTSTMSISVQNMQIYQYASYYSGLNDNVKVSVEKIENGIKYTYYVCRCGKRIIPLTNPCRCPHCGRVTRLR